jgi:hypothetical protein
VPEGGQAVEREPLPRRGLDPQLLARIFTSNTWNRIAITTAKVTGTDVRGR